MRISVISLVLCLVGCDTLHGLQIELASTDKQTLPAACVAEGFRKAGLELIPSGSGQARVREIGGKGFWFSVSYSDPTRFDIYLLAMHEPIACKTVQAAVPLMR
ncbi:MAG TPA: hypothetical protein VHQ87_10270, partial [Rhizobacter sp.]|nr:hypothetical protein [Rhizobacter sp.]